MTSPAPRFPVAPLVALGGVIVGILLGEIAGPGSALVPLIGGAAVLLVATRLQAPSSRAAVMAVALTLLGAAAAQRAEHGLTDSPLSSAVAGHADARIVATLVDDPDARRFDAHALVRVDNLAGRAAGGRRVLVTATGDVAGRLRLLSAGESVVLDGWLTELEGFDVRWRWKHAVAEFHATDLLAARPATAPLTRVANDLRGLVLAGSEHLAPTERALLAGFLLGDTRGVPDSLTEQFRAAGLTHLTAVSGENVSE